MDYKAKFIEYNFKTRCLIGANGEIGGYSFNI